MRSKLHPLTISVTNTFSTYKEDVKSYFGQALNAEINKCNDANLQGIGFLSTQLDPVIFEPAKNLSKVAT